jgi:uncharacterized repeat protein (TIGR01451 family)
MLAQHGVISSDPVCGGSGLANTDTIVRRGGTTLPMPGSNDTIPIEIVALSLTSVMPITVTYGGGSPNQFDVSVDLPPGPQPTGQMTMTRTGDTSGTLQSQLPVISHVTFTNQNPGGPQAVLDPLRQDNFTVSGTFTVQDGLIFSCMTPAVGSAGTVTCDAAALPAGETVTFQVVVHVNSNVADGATITNSATAATTTTDPTPGNNTGTATTTVNTQADLSVTKTDAPDPVTAGNNLTYTVTLTNNGPSDAQGVSLTDSVPANTTFVSETQNSGPAFTCANPAVGGTGTVSCTIATLASGASATFTIVVHVNASTADGATITNSATAAATTTDPTPGNNTATATTMVNTRADLSVTKTDAPDPVTAGNNLTYTVTLTNNGPSDAQAVSLTDSVPANTTFVSETQNSGPVFTCANPAVGGTGTVSCSIATLASGASATFTIVVHVNASTADGATITNSATAATTTTDPTPGNNTGTATTTVNTQADLHVTKSDNPDPVIAGTDLTYTIRVENLGPSNNGGFTLTDAIPVGTTFVSATSPDCVNASGTVTCTSAGLASGASVTWTITVHVASNLADGAMLSNTAAIATNMTTDPVSGNNTDTETTTVNKRSDLSVTKTDTPDPVKKKKTLTYTITVTNNGPSPATGVVMTDTLPAIKKFTSATSTVGTCAPPVSGVVTCTIGNLAVGANAVVTIVAKAPKQNGEIVNTATASATETDPVPANNTANQTTTVGRVAAVTAIRSLTDRRSDAANSLLTLGLSQMKRHRRAAAVDSLLDSGSLSRSVWEEALLDELPTR